MPRISGYSPPSQIAHSQISPASARAHLSIVSQLTTTFNINDTLAGAIAFPASSSTYLPQIDKSTQTSHSDELRAATLANIADLFKGADNQMDVGKRQNQELAWEFEQKSTVTCNQGSTAGDCVCLPPDVLVYKVKKGNAFELAYNCPELNGTGFGGIRNLPPDQLATIMDSYAVAAAEIKQTCKENGEQVLLLIANSGREAARRVDGAYAITDNSKMIWEKAFIADRCAEQFGSLLRPCYADSLDKFTRSYLAQIDAAEAQFQAGCINHNQLQKARKQAHDAATINMETYAYQALALLGYSRDVSECCNIDNGRPYLFGRPVNGLINDRAALNLSKTEGKVLDYTKFALINVSVDEGVNKFAAALAREKFHLSAEAAALPTIAKLRGFTYDVGGLDQLFHFKKGCEEDPTLRTQLSDDELATLRLSYFRAVSESEGIAGVSTALKEFLALGLKPLFKPNGTGQSKGIIGYRTGESAEDFAHRFETNLNDIERDFGKGAGYPFFVMPLLSLAETSAGEMYDLRFATYQKINSEGQARIHSIPLILKKEPAKTLKEKQQIAEFSPTNVSFAVAKTGRPGTDFIVPLCTESGLKQAGLSKEQALSMSLYFSSFQNWLLTNKYPRSLSTRD
ncbi:MULTISPECIES: hypothetical protein [unclassified Undibacterium]|nr:MULTISPECIES: hypothetical protein [unclassified Undibacterium]MEB0138309.1 hypothetical protein [Undibacterium sp. CCC2.1]MEB0174684.1 hypothetical protein [Undibacterium sp. CCC3.4]MEB0213881.1 hypothetical protein [Undibacterium sp. 5I2]WPX42607.1 hypothetical protein RHM61_14580 [Undibacterium sp. CCC3.4]